MKYVEINKDGKGIYAATCTIFDDNGDYQSNSVLQLDTTDTDLARLEAARVFDVAPDEVELDG